jgi:sugar lactone lactonase YvrE
MNPRLTLFAVLLCGCPALADDIYVANLFDPGYNTQCIEKFGPSGTKSLFVSANLSAPNGLAFDSQGDLYVANYGNNTISKYDPAGNGSVYDNIGLNQPHVIALDNSGNLYVANDANNAGYIEKIDAAGHATLFATGLYQPQGIACDSSGNVFVSTWINNMTALAILKYDPSGNRSTFAITSSLGIPRGLTFYSGNLYATFYNSVQRYAPNGIRTVATSTGLVNAIGVAFDSSGNFYVTDQGNGNVMKYAPNGVGAVFASGLNLPTYIAVGPVPEPSTSVLLSLGVTALLVGHRRPHRHFVRP